MSIEFTDNSAKVRTALTGAITAFLYEIGQALQSEAHDNSRVDTGQTRGSYKYVVDSTGNESTVSVGSDLENAIWEEFGTGEYAANGDGRKGGWVYMSEKDGKYHHTYGKKPNKPLTRAFQFTEPKIKRQLAEIIKQSVGE